jgi:hypothetical protein
VLGLLLCQGCLLSQTHACVCVHTAQQHDNNQLLYMFLITITRGVKLYDMLVCKRNYTHLCTRGFFWRKHRLLAWREPFHQLNTTGCNYPGSNQGSVLVERTSYIIQRVYQSDTCPRDILRYEKQPPGPTYVYTHPMVITRDKSQLTKEGSRKLITLFVDFC